MTDHPTPEALDEFIRGGLSEDASGRIERHLQEERCFPCLLAAREVMAEAELDLLENIHRFIQRTDLPESERDESFDAAVRQAERRGAVVTAERACGAELLAEIERRSPAARREVIRTAERYQLFGFAEHLCLESRAAVFHDVVRALELAELAGEVADSLDPRIYVARFTADLQALARAVLGNARRVASDLFGAEGAFQQALLLLEHGSTSSPAGADVGSLLGSLRIDQGRYYEARNVLQDAFDFHRSHESPRDEARILIQLADVEGYAGHPEKAVEILQRAVPLVESVNESRLQLQAHHNLTDWMVEAGEALEALARYEKTRPLYDRHSTEPSVRLRQRWLEGRIYAALGDAELATAALEEVRATARDRELSYELAMVSLELALVHLQQGHGGSVQDLAEEMTPIFRSHELHRHALAAMYLFRQAARSQTASVGFVQEVLRYLRRARNNPYQRFEPSARWA
jgi:tetratricopeptide (TPR) repeat protein